MPERRPAVSIGMPVRNGMPLLRKAIDSIRAQSFEDIEVIISDNGSDDGSSEVLRAFADEDARVRYIRQERPLRAFENFRFVLNQARGEYFMWAAHDDTHDVDFVARLHAALISDPDAVLAFGDVNVVTDENPDGTEVPHDFETVGLGRQARMRKGARLQCFHIYGLWRTAAIRAVPPTYCSWWPDLPVMLAAAILGPFAYVPDTRFHYYEVVKTSMERARKQDYVVRFSLPLAVAALVGASYRACAAVGGRRAGLYAALLVIEKQFAGLPGFVARRLRLSS